MKKASKLARVAGLVDQLARTVENHGLPRKEAVSARIQVGELVALLRTHSSPDAPVLTVSLSGLAAALARIETQAVPRRRPTLAHRRRFKRALKRIAAVITASVFIATAQPAFSPDSGAAYAALLTPVIGGPVTNPTTGAAETAVDVFRNVFVRTSLGNIIILAVDVNDEFTLPSDINDPDGPFTTFRVTGTTVADGRVTSITLHNVTTNTAAGSLSTIHDKNSDIATVLNSGSPGAPGGSFNFPPAAGDFMYQATDLGDSGSGGSDGGGICIPVIGCIAVWPDSGDPGEAGENITATIDQNWIDTQAPWAGQSGIISTISNNRSGVFVSSVGGNGGNGGDGYGVDIPGASGGRAGAGGDVTVNSSVTIVTTGDNAHGMYVQSRAGFSGNGGSGYIASGGGGGGAPGQGGRVEVTNSGHISTDGLGSHGIQAQSLGGGAGAGGDSYGIVGDPDDGAAGGQGGEVIVHQRGVIETLGVASHGVLAQSIGGSGGNSGEGGGIVSFGGSGNAGGDGGAVTINAYAGSSTITQQARSHGLFAQSIGGGGGSGTPSAGLVAFGADGGAGGDGDKATIMVEAGAGIATGGASSHGVFAQSVGGGGGSGGTASSGVSFGSKGAAGGDAGEVEIDVAGQIDTYGVDSRGVFAQSIGGGGGAAGSTGGVVSIGGEGVAGGVGRLVDVNAAATSYIVTRQRGGDGIFAQSIGGGGGAGSSAGGLVALGGSGGGGGDGGVVNLTNAGTVMTGGSYARGLFAQSVGGGGGTGGDSSGLASIGGTGGAASKGGDVTVINSGYVSTLRSQSSAIQAQSVGGGGGDGGSSGGGFLTIGGSGASGGAGGNVRVDHRGELHTAGNDSHGILAQSIGGGGGNGGSASSVSLFAGVAIGGAADDGGPGGAVDINLLPTVGPNPADPLIVTAGDRSRGVFAQSVGGGGGNGGFAAQVSAGYGVSASAAIGGTGGAGGAGGLVTLDGGVRIQTRGDYSQGIFAQSVGGGGGAGGIAASFSFAVGETAAAAFSTAIGGAGDSGGEGGNVLLDSGGAIETRGKFSTGLVAQSVGGGGGVGGYSIAFSGAAAGTASASVAASIGGEGGNGGFGGLVDATFDGTILTLGDDSGGAVIQSIGGGGGSGGFAISGAMAFAGAGALGASAAMGGSGGLGGYGGQVDGHLGNVRTEGDRSAAVIVQSVGGGGGAGGFSVAAGIAGASGAAGSITLGMGGAAGGGGAGGNVNASAGSITTLGNQSNGFVAQSLGGGGGAGGFNISGGVTLSKSLSGNIGLGMGGSGGGGGDAGTAHGVVTGDIYTEGENSAGVLVQSAGGGGGAGGMNITGGVALSNGGAGNILAGFGGAGGAGGMGRAVTGSVTGDVTTRGRNAYGIAYQSLGGGGGAGGMNITGGLSASLGGSGTLGFGMGGFGGAAGDGGTVNATLNGDVITEGDNAFGAMLQSAGGGGGAGGMNVTGGASFTVNNSAAVAIGVGIGGFGGGGGNANTVTGRVTGTYRTSGDEADGVVAQSLGGAGGAGGLNISGALSIAAGASGAAAIGVGGFGGTGGSAERVNLTRIGDTYTDGAGSDGVIAQSVGGGGGAGGLNVSGAAAVSISGQAGALSAGLGGFGGTGGDAKSVTAHVTGNVIARGFARETVVDGVRTRLNGSHGVVAQSVGGGGGAGGTNISGTLSISSGGPMAARAVTLGVGGFGGGGGDADIVDLTVDAPGADRVQVMAAGDERSAVIAQSLGGGGGAGGLNISGGIALDGQVVAGVGGFGGGGGLARNVTANVDADLFASGTRARGLLAQSVGGGGGSGGINISGGISANLSGNDPSLVFGMGGNGGPGNISGSVTATQNGQVTVDGVNAVGVLAQSVAGGGGDGGLNVTGNLSLGKGYGFGVGIGGSGGAGADSQRVDLTSSGNILMNARLRANPVAGEDPLESTGFTGGGAGVIAQSLGGGGGVGGVNAQAVIAPTGSPMSVAIGGDGGSGGSAGIVNVIRGTASQDAGLIRTFGDDVDGLFAQSLGGGGGKAGMNFSFIGSAGQGPNSTTAAANIVIGGGGAGAGRGEAVTVDHHGDIITEGDNSEGLFAQSLGGGGGDANLNIGFGLVRDSTNLNFALGGATGAGGEGGAVTVDHDGTIVTRGDNAVGIKAQSIGGGGGNASINTAIGVLSKHNLNVALGREGGSGGSAGAVTVNADGLIDTTGDAAHGILAHSVGGGGGTSGTITVGGSTQTGATERFSGSVSVGLTGGDSAIGGQVTVFNRADIRTRGDEARGVFAQSIGGGGGAGGSATNVLLRSSGAMAVGVGGSGGSGSTSGLVNVENFARIHTSGARSDGVLAQSIGGGGGTGGFAALLNLQAVGGTPTTNSTTATVNVGGPGGTGSEGNTVTVTNAGVIVTEGELSFGVRAQSIGGGGGVGGAVISTQVNGSTENQSLEVNVGGSGGSGGEGGLVRVVNEGLIGTTGRGAAAISANSIGGGGGDAGVVLDIQVGSTDAKQNTNSFQVNIGGSGGTGGVGGEVRVINRPTSAENSGLIVTTGADAYGVFAQSLGGGGGNGSSIISFSGVRSGKDSNAIGFNLGGIGGSGNTGGLVTVENAGLIDTSGDGAHGVLAQSIGGGGGNGGFVIAASALIRAQSNASLTSVGGFGGDGGDGGEVRVDNTGSIFTRGANADGIVAQSIGGGGGDLNFALSLAEDVEEVEIAQEIAGAVGNFGGGSGGQGGAVTVNHSGDITVLGDGSQAIRAESINGGGGSLTLDFSGITGLKGVPFIGSNGAARPGDPLVAARAGAKGATDMNAGLVTVNTTGTFGAGGNNAVAILTQAIGGGGGSVGIVIDTDDGSDPIDTEIVLGGEDGEDNTGGDIETAHNGAVVTAGSNTPGLVIQSIGGGGGTGLIDIAGAVGAANVVLGGVNGLNESGGDIFHTVSGGLFTTGDFSFGAIIQSIGGGGGSASVFLNTGFSPAADDVFTTAAFLTPAALGPVTGGAPVSVTLGATGGAGLDGGDVSTAFSGGVMTAGDHAVGLLVQSIGAGGGETRVSGAGSLDVTLGATGGASGHGGAVSVINTGAVQTAGDRAHGVVLQSIGGGGGAVFAGLDGAVHLRGGNTGDGGAIVFQQAGDIAASGEGAYGVVAQSIGGGGGWVDGVFAGAAGGAGVGGAISLLISGDVQATGEDAVGVFAQSAGANGAGDIIIDVDGAVVGGGGSGAGIRIAGGADNTIDITGGVAAFSGVAIQAGDGNETVTNRGVMLGSLDLGGGVNSFNNAPGAIFFAGPSINLNGGTLTNAGEFHAGSDAPRVPGNPEDLTTAAVVQTPAPAIITTVNLNGNYVQTASGHLAFDTAFGPYPSDRLNAKGSATLAGASAITLTWLENNDPVTLISAAGGVVDNGLAVTDTLAMDYSLTASGNALNLSYVSDFSQPFLNANGRALGAYFNNALETSGAPGLGRVLAMLGNIQAGEEAIYAAAFREMDPSPHLAPLRTQLAAADGFSRHIFNCGAPTARSDEACMWATIENTSATRDYDADTFGQKNAGISLLTGAERALNETWSLAVAGGYERLDHITVDGRRAYSEGNAVHAGVGVEHRNDSGLRAGVSVAGGWQWLDTTRQSEIFVQQAGQASPQSGYLQIRGGVSHMLRAGRLFAQPGVSVTGTILRSEAFSETGFDGLGVDALSETQSLAAVNPELTVGVVLDDRAFSEKTFSISAGATYRTEDELARSFALQGAPGAMAYETGLTIDPETYHAGAQLHIVGDDRLDASIGYRADFGDTTQNHTFGVNVRVKF